MVSGIMRAQVVAALAVLFVATLCAFSGGVCAQGLFDLLGINTGSPTLPSDDDAPPRPPEMPIFFDCFNATNSTTFNDTLFMNATSMNMTGCIPTNATEVSTAEDVMGACESTEECCQPGTCITPRGPIGELGTRCVGPGDILYPNIYEGCF